MGKQCFECGAAFKGDDHIISGSGIKVCSSCAYRYFTKCPDCGEFNDRRDMLKMSRWLKVCFWCAAEKYFICPHCRKLERKTFMKSFHKYNICMDCFLALEKNCHRCGFSVKDPVHVFKKTTCSKCAEILRKEVQKKKAVKSCKTKVKPADDETGECSNHSLIHLNQYTVAALESLLYGK